MRQNKLRMVSVDGDAIDSDRWCDLLLQRRSDTWLDTNVAEVKGQAYLVYR